MDAKIPRDGGVFVRRTENSTAENSKDNVQDKLQVQPTVEKQNDELFTENSKGQARSTESKKVMLSKRRHRLGSMPTKFSQTDEELQKQVLLKQTVKSTKSFHYPDADGYSVRAKMRGNTVSSDRMAGKSSPKFTHENIYRGLLQSLLHPLGAPDNTVGLRPGDLIDHVREVFEVERDDHELYIMEEMQNRPQNLQVNVAVLEANGLRGPNLSEDTCDSYCLVMVHHPSRGKSSGLSSPRISPKISPAVSPMNSPALQRKGGLSPNSLGSSDSDVQRTSTVKNSSHPKWNEEFSLEIEDYLTDEIHIYLCNEEVTMDARQEKSNAVKNFLGILRHSEQQVSPASMGYLGRTSVPVRDISALGCDNWYDVVSLEQGKGKQKPVGKCHLRLNISYQQDLERGCDFSSEDYYQAFRHFLNFTFRNSKANPSRHVDDHYGALSLKDDRILKMFASAHSISKLSQAMVSVICLLEIQCEEAGTQVGEMNLHLALDELRMTWATMQIGQKHLLDRMPLTDIEISNYRKVAAKYMQLKCDSIEELPELFPPTVENLNLLKSKLGVIVQLLGLDLWEPKSLPQRDISQVIMDKLHQDLNTWIDKELADITETSNEIKDKVIPEVERLINLVDVTCSHCSEIPVLKNFYSTFGINYYRIISFSIEKKISYKAIDIMTAMNKYKKRYNCFAVNIMSASKLSLRLYFSLRKFHTVIKENVSRREVFRLTVFHYQEWFEESMIYWLQTFQTECIHRMEKALEIDKDVVVVTSLVKYSHSSVDVLSCFAQVIGEWRKIDFRDPDCALMGVTNITDMICDGAQQYTDKIQQILKRNCYYDEGLNAEFDVTDRLCITLNNIEHVRLYLEELPKLLAWDTIVMMISTKYGNDQVGKQATATFNRLIENANKEILVKSFQLLQQICEKMRSDMKRLMEIFMIKESQKASSVDQFLGYISTNLQTLHNQLMPNIYPYMIEQLWNVILQVMDQQLLVGEHPDYYDQMKQHLRAVGSFFLRSGWDEKMLHTDQYEEFRSRLDINSKNSEELMLMYYHELATDLVTPTECYGHLAFKIAYIEETRGNVTVYVTVLRGSELPGLDATGFSDPYVEISIRPNTMFGTSRVQRTQIVKKTLNPVFNTTFQFPNIPKELLQKQGACVILTVLDHDTIGRDDFAGEVVMHMPSILKISIDRSMDKMPAVIMPLKRPKRPKEGPYMILAQREWDKEAKKFIAERSRFIDHQPERTDKQKPSDGFLSSILSTLTS